MHEEHVDVGGVVELSAAELPEGDDGDAAPGRLDRSLDAGFRDVGDLRDDVLERRAGQIARGDAEHRSPAEDTEPCLHAASSEVRSGLRAQRVP